ncbi:MAG: carboxypeptidase regulatory-like domain-containing protein, partial [Patescibacteria group bacterium]
MNFTGQTQVAVVLSTNLGTRVLLYAPHFTEATKNGTVIFYPFPNANNGAWQTFTRDLAADLQAFEPTATLDMVRYMSFKGQGKIDNVKLLSTAAVHTISGTITENSTPLSDVTVTILPDNLTFKTKADGKYAFPSLSDGAYTIKFVKNSYTFTPQDQVVSLSGSHLTQDAQGTVNPIVTLEDAEDGTISRWRLENGGTIENIIDPEHTRVIRATDATIRARFFLTQAGGAFFNNTTHKFLRWDMRSADPGVLMVTVETSEGTKVLNYSPQFRTAIDGNNLYIGLDPSIGDGTWRTVTRNLEADIQSFVPGVTLRTFNYLTLRIKGSWLLDNVALLMSGS